MDSLNCPTCDSELTVLDEGAFRCREEHTYTVAGLALTTNIAALRAIWMAIRALEDDAASLTFMAEHYGDTLGQTADDRRDEAEAARAAATVLRVQAQRAQERLDALPAAPSANHEQGSGPSRST